MDQRITATLIILLHWCHVTHTLIGYDCGSTSNITTVSLLSTEECDVPPKVVNTTQVYLQLLQISEIGFTEVIQCKVELDRLVKRCGMFSHTMDVANGKYSYIQEVSREACIHMHTYGTYTLGTTFVTGLRPNNTVSRPVTLAGRLDNEGACSGTAYTDAYGSWTDVVVIGTLKVTLQNYRASVKLNTNQIILRSGVNCELKKEHCTDIEGGDTFWSRLPSSACVDSDFDVLYEGQANRMIDSQDITSQTVYSITTQETTFSLASRGSTRACAYALIQTEHPKIFILETHPNANVFKKTGNPANRDIFTYTNSKFVYIEKHIKRQLDQLYRSILQQQCNLEQKMLQNALAIATQSPDVFAYHLMKGPGYTSVLGGEVIHIIKCLPVEVRAAPSTDCYLQLPVLRGNQTYYLTPQTHLLLRQGTQVACNPIAPNMYLLGDAWYKVTPKLMEGLPPTILKPMTRPDWKYVSPDSLATSGIYTQADLEELRDHIMFPAERSSVLNSLARGIMGQPAVVHGGSIANLLDEAALEKLAASTWTKLWGRFLVFGNISAGVLGVFVIIRTIKLILDTFIHGVALHSIYGWSCYLIGAIWDSLTQLLLLRGRNKTAKPTQPYTELQDLNKATTDHTPSTNSAPIPAPKVPERQKPCSSLLQEETGLLSQKPCSSLLQAETTPFSLRLQT